MINKVNLDHPMADHIYVSTSEKINVKLLGRNTRTASVESALIRRSRYPILGLYSFRPWYGEGLLQIAYVYRSAGRRLGKTFTQIYL
jgi:hypothetical protein